jgi:hypothetical protein
MSFWAILLFSSTLFIIKNENGGKIYSSSPKVPEYSLHEIHDEG